MKELGEKLYKLQQEAIKFKSILNEAKIALGIILNQLKEIYDNGEFEGIPELDPNDTSFNQFLAELHLNRRRVHQIMSNAKYLLGLETQVDMYSYLDSSVIDLCRKKNLDPTEYIYNSFSDILELTK